MNFNSIIFHSNINPYTKDIREIDDSMLFTTLMPHFLYDENNIQIFNDLDDKDLSDNSNSFLIIMK